MGLKNGKDGVKFSLRRKYDLAFGLFPNYAECVEAFKQTPSDVILVVDGNVLLRQLPRLVGRDGTENLPAHNAPAELDDYVQILTGRFHAFFRAANTVVLVFDEPQTITMAKQEEQSKRDGSSKQVRSSSDFKLNTDSYTLRDMKLADPLHDLVKGRAARPRFSDQVIRMVKQKLAPFLRLNKKTFVVDGADPRGALREVGCLRVPRITAVGHDAVAMARWFCDYAHSGEGDLKLARMYERVLAAHGNDAAPESLRGLHTYFSFTIDGDEYPIQLLQAARRDAEDNLDPPVRLFSGIYEVPPKDEWEVTGDKRPRISFCDVNLLYRMILSDTFGEKWKALRRRTTAVHRREVMTLVAAGWCLLGCDFVTAVKKLTFQRVMDVATAFCNTSKLQPLAHLWSGTRHDVRLLVPPVLKRFLDLEERTRGTLVSRLGDNDEEFASATRQAAWLMRYWTGEEITESLEDFDFSIDPTSREDRRAEQLRRRSVRNHLVFSVVRLLALAKRARRRLAQRAAEAEAEAASVASVASVATATEVEVRRPRKRRRVVLPTGMGRA